MIQKIKFSLKSRILLLLLRVLSTKNNFSPQDSLIIFSDPRGGSTWLAEILNNIPKTAIIWEPLHLDKGAEIFRTLQFHWRQYIPEDAQWTEATNAFEQLFRGKLLNSWLCSRASFSSIYQARYLLFKFCRGNALIPWVINQFSFVYKPIYLVRHPFAVVSSQLRHGAWDYTFTGFQLPCMPYPQLYLEHKEYLSKLGTKEEMLVAIWCITNLVPLRHKYNNYKWITMNYENLLSNPTNELIRVFSQWNIELPKNILSKIDKPSSTTKDTAFSMGVQPQLEKWKKDLSSHQIEMMTAVLEYFQVEFYTAQSVLPVISFL